MADDKEKKEGGGGGTEPLMVLIAVVIVVFILERLWAFLLSVVQNRGYATASDALNHFLSSLFYGAESFILYFTIASNILSVLFLMGIVYATIHLRELNHAENLRLKAAEKGGKKTAGKPVGPGTQWESVIENINSLNPSSWRLAIIEADVILDDLLDKIGCVGNTIGDKLKQVNKGDFKTLDSAWEAHRVRNAIAHEGSEFLLTSREAKRVISLYEQVFKEFHFV